MSTRKNRATTVIALILVIAMSQAYAHANLLKTGFGLLADPTLPHSGGEPAGRLVTRGNNPVTVNGNSAKTGETVFSGQQIQTPSETGATVQLGSLGRVDIAPNTNLTLIFDANSIKVRLASGCVILNPKKGVKGVVETLRQGVVEQADAAPGSAVDVCANPTGAPVVNRGAAAAAGAGANEAQVGGLFGMSPDATVSFVGAMGIATLATTEFLTHRPCNRGRNPSPGVPRGRNDECR